MGKNYSSGNPAEIRKSEHSIIGQYLSGKLSISVPNKIRTGHEGKGNVLTGGRENNLQNHSITIKLGTFISVTGVLCGGKSSLIIHTFYQAAPIQASMIQLKG